MLDRASTDGGDIPALGFGTWPMMGDGCVHAVECARKRLIRRFAAAKGRHSDGHFCGTSWRDAGSCQGGRLSHGRPACQSGPVATSAAPGTAAHQISVIELGGPCARVAHHQICGAAKQQYAATPSPHRKASVRRQHRMARMVDGVFAMLQLATSNRNIVIGTAAVVVVLIIAAWLFGMFDPLTAPVVSAQ